MPLNKRTGQYYTTASEYQIWGQSQPSKAWIKSKMRKKVPSVYKGFSKPAYKEEQPHYTKGQTRFGRKIKGGWNMQLLPHKPHHAAHVSAYYKRQEQRARANKNRALALQRKRKYVDLT